MMPEISPQPRKAERESGLELLRILCMVFIVADHYAGQSGAAMYDTLPNALFFSALGAGSRLGCDLFVVLGAWFLCRQPFRTRRVLGLWLSLWLYTVPLTLICWCIPGSNVGLGTLRWAIFPVSTQQLWFVAQYILLLLLSPVLNLILRAVPRNGLRVLLVLTGVFSGGISHSFCRGRHFRGLALELSVPVSCHRVSALLPGQSPVPAAAGTGSPLAGACLCGAAHGGPRRWRSGLGIGGKLMQYLEYYRTALGAAPNLLCALCFFLCLPEAAPGQLQATQCACLRHAGRFTVSTRPRRLWGCSGQISSIRLTMRGRRFTRYL